MGLKSDYLSYEVCLEKAASPCTFKNSNSLSPTKACNDGHHSSSETSNLLSVCSSGDLSTENGESKSIMRVCDASEGISTLSMVAVSKATAECQHFLELQHSCDKRTFLNQLQMLKVSECHGDDMSCISGAESPSMSGDHGCDIDRKNVSCSSASVDSSRMGGLEKTVDVQLDSCCQASSQCEVEKGRKHNCCHMPIKFSKESLQETAPFSSKSDPLEVSSVRDVYSGARPVKEDLSECSREPEESACATAATVTLDDCKHDVLDIAESVKPKTEVDKGDPDTAARKFLDQNECLVPLEVSDAQGPPEQSQAVKHSDESDLMVDVKVCDICGDAGREYLLATCSKCSDGAEHTYCMRIRLEKVPEGEWMCEDCMLQEETEKQMQNKFQTAVRTPQGSSSNEISQISGKSNTDIRTCLELDNNGSEGEKSRQNPVSSIPRICAKRPAGNLETESIVKKRALETSAGSPRMSVPCRKALLSQDSGHKKLDNMKSKPTCHVSTFGDRAFKSTSQGNAHAYLISGSISPKSRTSFQMLRGALTKSISFNISDSKLKFQAPAEDMLEKQKLPQEIAASDKREHGIVRKLSKSLSCNNVGSGHSKASKIQMLSSNISVGKDLKRFTHPKDHNSTQRKYKAKLDDPLRGSPVAGSCISASRIGKKIASHIETMLPRSSGTKCYPKPIQICGSSNISPNPTPHLALDGSKYLNNDHAESGVVKKLHSCLSKADEDHSLKKFNSSHKLKPNVVSGKNRSRLSDSLTAGGHCNGFHLTGQGRLPHLEPSCNQSGKVQKTSYFSSARVHISPGNRSAGSNKCDNIGEARESFPVMSPQTYVLDTGSSNEANLRNEKVCGPIFCDQADASSFLAVPKFGYVWKGGFKIQSSRRLPSFCYGIQAHLSNCASPKVPEVVKKLPCNVLLQQVSRSSVWPLQFLENPPKEDSIGVYFFAEDMLSYGGNYRSLMECMINYDLALTGNVDGNELLIFSSNLLPEKSQQWNKLFFLWGIFRGRRVSDEECLPSSQKKLSVPGSINVSSHQDLSTCRISGIQDACSPGQSKECVPASKLLFYNAQQPSSLIDPLEFPSVTPGIGDWNYEHQSFSNEQKHSHLQTKHDQPPSTDDATTSSFPMQKQLCMDMQHTLAPMKKYILPERRLEDYLTTVRANNHSMDCVIWSSGRAHNMEATDNSRAADGFLSADCKGCVQSEFLDLRLSLGVGNEYKKQDKNPNSIVSTEKHNGDNNEFSASVELSLALPAFEVP